MLTSIILTLLSCSGGADSETSTAGAAGADVAAPGVAGADVAAPGAPTNRQTPPGGQPTPSAGQRGAPPHPPPGQSLQDPSGFPVFHSLEPPRGPAPEGLGDFSEPVKLTARPTGGYRPQIAVGPDGTLNVVYYDRAESGDVVRYRRSSSGADWTEPEAVSQLTGRNWGPDLIARADGSLVLTWDHAEPNFSSQGWLRVRSPQGTWGEATTMTPGSGYEVGSTHVAPGVGDALYYVYIGRPAGRPGDPFRAYWRYSDGSSWTEPVAFTDGHRSAWHTNVEARPDGTVQAGWDEGPGGGGTELMVAEGHDGTFDPPQNLSAGARQGERPHWAFAPDGSDYVTYFHRGQGSRPLHVFVRRHKDGAWGPVAEPSEGLGGYHYDPEIAVNDEGLLCMVWGWDSGEEAELLYSLSTGEGWSAPRQVAAIGWGKPGLPSIDVDHQGRFHVVWNQGVRGYNEVYYASLSPEGSAGR